jgi:DNA-binding MarR family transcriptional regulator
MRKTATARVGATPRAPTTGNLGFELAKGSQRWNERLTAAFATRGFPEVRAAYGSVLLPLFEEDGLRMGDIAARARLSKQTITTLVRRVADAGLVRRVVDPADARAARIELTPRGHQLAPVAADVVASLDRGVRATLSADEYHALRRGLRALMEL